MKLLYGVQTTGNGHLTRSLILIQALRKLGHEVDVIFSGQAKKKWQLEPFGPHRIFRGLTFIHRHGKLALLRTLFNANFWRLYRDSRRLNLTGYDLVISDFEPVSAWAGKRQGIFTLGIGRQYAFAHDVPFPRNALISRFISKHFAPADLAIGMHWHHFNQPILPPIIKALGKPSDNGSVLVYMPFESLHHITALLQRHPNQQFVVFHPDIHQASTEMHIHYEPLSQTTFAQALQRCHGIVCNAGFMLISEALSLGKKILTKPLKGQVEQQANVMALEQLGYGTAMHHLCERTLNDWLEHPASKPVHFPAVAEPLAQWITAAQWDTLPEFARSLW